MTTTQNSFEKSNFNWDGMYLTYGDILSPLYSETHMFIARFKYRNVPITKAKFMKELIASKISVADYKAKIDSGMTPHAILDENNEDWSKRVVAAWHEKIIKKSQSRYSHVLKLA
tara:strand:+ start:852 stop:1196 length:345 start_codon:yes stop_codon:yes gene_type:complete